VTIWYPLRRFFERSPAPADWPPPELPEETAEPEYRFSPAAAPVHVMSGSALVRVIESTLIVERQGEPGFARPIELVSALHIHGWAGVTSPCVGRLTAQGTPVVWQGVHGYPIALAVPMHSAGLEVRRAQYEHAGGERGLAIARELVAAKIASMRGLVRRRADIAGRDSLGKLASLARRARRAGSLDALLGLEGSATALYFSAWPHMLADRAEDIEFETRTRRPPQNAVNAMLSYAYAVLASECLCVLAATGLDPRLGVLHQPRAGRAALALDLMEPFRPLIADQAVLAGLNTAQMKLADALETESGWSLNEGGKRSLLELIEKRLMMAVTIDGAETPLSYRDIIGRQAQAIAGALRTGAKFQAMERP
jgi:CRISPR-associated endonuclease Cas1